MWEGRGFSGKIGGSALAAEAQSDSDPTHDLRPAAPRYYMLLAAKRLAMLIKMIRQQPGYVNVAINFLCHSQGCMVTMLAHAFLAEEGEQIAADTLIFQHPPYSLEEAYWGNDDTQQSTQSRVENLKRIVAYVNQCKKTSPALANLEQPKMGILCTTGKYWQAQSAQRWVDSAKRVLPFTERDNRGKVYLYFCPQDGTVGLMNVQGIGWSGVPSEIKAKPAKSRYEKDEESISVLSALGPSFKQRIFTARLHYGDPLKVGMSQGQVSLRDSKFENIQFGATKTLENGATRYINAETLNPPILPDIAGGDDVGEVAQQSVSPVDAANAVAQKSGILKKTWRIPDPRTQEQIRNRIPVTDAQQQELAKRLPGQTHSQFKNDRLHILGMATDATDPRFMLITYSAETPNQARLRWRREGKMPNTYHSCIPAAPAHARGVTAYDVSLGWPAPFEEVGKLSYWDYLRAVANWRTDWLGMKQGTSQIKVAAELLSFLNKESTPGARQMTLEAATYYKTGKLPSWLAINEKVVLAKPKILMDMSVNERNKWGKR